MRNSGFIWGVSAAITAAGWLSSLSARAGETQEARAAAKLVEEVLQCEAKGGVPDREEWLRPAIAQSPACQAARWQSGFVFDAKRKQWLRWDQAQQRAAGDDLLAEYRQTREKSSDTIDGQLALARWCSKHKLDDQAKAHLTRVLEIDPNHAEARKLLGFRLEKGTWVDDRHAAEARTATRNAMTAAAKWIPRLEKLRDRLAGNNASQQEKARQTLMAIRDPDAVEAIDTVFCRPTNDLSLLGIELLKNIPTPRATAVLAWHAAYSPWVAPWTPVGQAAATALRSREKYDYVPLLLDAAETPVQAPTYVADKPTRPNRHTARARPTIDSSPETRTVYRLDFSVNTYSWQTVEQLKDHPYWWQVPQMRFNPVSPNPVAKTTTNSVMTGAGLGTVQTREYFVVRNGQLQDRRTQNRAIVYTPTLVPVGTYTYPRNPPMEAEQKPVEPPPNSSATTEQKPGPRAAHAEAALAEATGVKGPRSPSAWRQWWYRYNDVYSSSDKLPEAPDQPKSIALATAGSPSQWGDCLAAGTLVATETGPMPIEAVAVGDRIFCCDAETGCVALKPVLRKTVRPEGRLLRIRAGGEQFEASGGQVFWVAGQGWVKARELRDGMRLHTIRGTLPVEGVEPGPSQASMGLVAADFHTLFAGKGMVLTHDNTIRRPTDRVVPGANRGDTTDVQQRKTGT
jgi:hypothetical protein